MSPVRWEAVGLELSFPAKLLLANERTLYSLKDGQLEWFTVREDARIFSNVIKKLIETAHYDDAQFRDEIIPVIEGLIDGSSVFVQLQDRNIQVTPAHQGTTPYQHSLNVLRDLNTSPVSGDVRSVVMLRLAALYHDVGKGIGAGLSVTEAQAFRNGHQHSYPSHPIMSALIIQRLIQEFENIGISFDGKLDSDFFPELTFLVNNHHLFSLFEAGEITPEEIVKMIKENGVDNEDSANNVYLIPLLYLLCRADVAAIDGYRDAWSKTVEWMELIKNEILKQFPVMPVHLAWVLLGVLELPEELSELVLEFSH